MWKSSDPGCLARRTENAELLKVLPQKLIDGEAQIAPYRWAGYQFMSPLECTKHFAADYRKQFASTFYGDCYFEPQIGSEEFATLWAMRLAADQCFHMSYRTYLAISFHLVRNKNPEPYRRPHLIFQRRQETPSWNSQSKKVFDHYWPRDRANVAAMGHYQRNSYCGLPAQDTFRNNIKRNAKSNGWGWTAERYVFQSPVLSPSELVSEIGGAERVEAIAQMRAIHRPIVLVAEKVESNDLIQTCFAWPRSGSHAERCSHCPQQVACAGLMKEL